MVKYCIHVSTNYPLFIGGFNYYYAVAVVKQGGLSDVISVKELKGKRACFAGVETFAGWMLPISTVSSTIKDYY